MDLVIRRRWKSSRCGGTRGMPPSRSRLSVRLPSSLEFPGRLISPLRVSVPFVTGPSFHTRTARPLSALEALLRFVPSFFHLGLESE